MPASSHLLRVPQVTCVAEIVDDQHADLHFSTEPSQARLPSDELPDSVPFRISRNSSILSVAVTDTESTLSPCLMDFLEFFNRKTLHSCNIL